MEAVLYGMRISNASQVALGALRVKRMRFRFRDLVPGFHPAIVRALGFPGWTVPALRLDDRRIQGSREIVRALQSAVPSPSLFPADPARRRAVEEAEAWGEGPLQDVPRRIFRWAMTNDLAARRWLIDDLTNLPAPGIVARLGAPLPWLLARHSRADEDTARADVRGLPELLDRVDVLIAQGTIGGPQPNAADLQILASVRTLLGFADLRPLVEGRPAGAAAGSLMARSDTAPV